ncbi:hypothetical protein GCM10010421_28180 [Streptomyces glaucus]|uniref:HTH iclR-type domain-containing protein n=1 Tax=Streptomyces glaucus TaxID=284029 RepID=A0ABN3JSI5_9ACTN
MVRKRDCWVESGYGRVNARKRFVNVPGLSERLSVPATTVRNHIQLLAASGLLDPPNPMALAYRPSVKGEVVLDICRILTETAKPDGDVTSEFLYVLEVLGLRCASEPISMTWLPGLTGHSLPLRQRRF